MRIQKLLAILVFFVSTSFCQSQKFESVEIQASQPGDQATTYGILPNGHVFFRNMSLRRIAAAAYNIDPSLVTGGPDWLDSSHYSIEAKASSSSSQADSRLMLQALLTERFKLALHHEKHTSPVYALRVGKDGPKLKTAADSSSSNCDPKVVGPGQIQVLCHSLTMPGLAETLARFAPNYLNLPVVDLTGLKGSYDLEVDWMGRGMYDQAVANAAKGAPKDPHAVSIFDAMTPLGLSLEKYENPIDSIVIEKAQPIPANNLAHRPDRTLTPDQISSIDRSVSEEMAHQHIPDLAVGIYHRGQILLAKGYGLSNVELNVPVRPETIFQSGSVGKQFVSAAVMMLVEEGKVGLDDSIVKYFPNAPASWKPILVKHLLSHTSGLAEYETPDRMGPTGPFYLRLDFSEDEMVNKVEALPIEFAPGEKWDYRNTNYLLLGVLIHKVTGMHFSEFLQERIFKPWYMTSTRLISDKDIVPNRAAGYEWVNGKLQNQDWVSPTFNSTGDGTLYFDVLDLAKWDEALYGTSMLKQSSLDRIWTVFPLNNGTSNPADYGFGWGIHSINGHKLIEHGGAWQGFTCVIQRYVDDNLTVVVLINMARTGPGVFANRIAGILNPALLLPARTGNK
jgi:uncharacterized protein (TIGR03435 family)